MFAKGKLPDQQLFLCVKKEAATGKGVCELGFGTGKGAAPARAGQAGAPHVHPLTRTLPYMHTPHIYTPLEKQAGLTMRTPLHAHPLTRTPLTWTPP